MKLFYPREFSKALREGIKDKQKRRCWVCKKSEKKVPYGLLVHHHDRDRYNNQESNLFALCYLCHTIEHYQLKCKRYKYGKDTPLNKILERSKIKEAQKTKTL